MQENLYFQPENYGSGKKKEHKEPKKKSEKKDHRVLKLLGFLLFLLIIILIILWLLRGKSTTSGVYPGNIRNESLTCISTDAIYEKTTRFTPNNRELKINMIFYGTEKLSSSSLKYTLTFGTSEEAYSAEAFNHAEFNLDLQKRGYSSGSFNNKFTLMDNVLVLTLRADRDELESELAREYFLLDRTSLPTTLDEYRTYYESTGFNCSSTINNN